MSDEAKFSRYDWERWLRRCVLPPTTKLVGFVMATYSARDGSRVFPGVARLAATTGLSERTVRTALGNLRDVGLVERVAEGGRRGTQVFTDVHRLMIPADLMDRVDLLSPDEDVVPKRQQLPPGKPRGGRSQPANESTPTGNQRHPNRQMTTSQPATAAPQQSQGTDQGTSQVTTEGQALGTQPTTGDNLLAELIRIDELAARRRGA